MGFNLFRDGVSYFPSSEKIYLDLEGEIDYYRQLIYNIHSSVTVLNQTPLHISSSMDVEEPDSKNLEGQE